MTTAELPRIAVYRPAIVWGTGTGVDTSQFDNVGAYALGVAVDGIGRDQIRAYAPPKAPTLRMPLTNYDGRFSPGGPLALFLGRGPAVTLEADWGVDVEGDAADVSGDDTRVLGDGAAVKRLFTGSAVDMPQQIELGEEIVDVTAIGGLAALVTTFPTTVLYENIRTDQAITVLLDAAGWPADKRVLDTADTTLLFWFLNGQTSCMEALNALLAAEGAGSCAYEDGGEADDDGTPFGDFHFQGRQFRENNTRSQTVQWAFFDSVQAGDAIGDATDVLGDATTVLGDGAVENALFYTAPAEYRSNPDEVVVSVAATILTRTETAVQQVWEYGGPLVLAAAEVRDIEVAASDPFKDAIVPRDGTDYTISVGSPLSGISLLTTSGQTVTLRLTAPVGGCTIIGVTSNGIQVRAVSLPVASTQVVTSTINTALSAARQGAPNNPLALNCWPELESNQALDLVNSMALRYQRERRQMTFQMVNFDAIHQYAMFDLRPSDRIQLVHQRAQINMQLWVEQLSLTVGLAGLMTLTVGCEQVFDLGGGVFDDALFDTAVFGF